MYIWTVNYYHLPGIKSQERITVVVFPVYQISADEKPKMKIYEVLQL